MQKKVLLFPIIALTSLLSLSPIYAVSPSPSSSPKSSALPSPSASPASDKEAIENLKKRLQTGQEEKTNPPSSSARAYIGIVKDVIKDTVIIEDKDGKKDISLEDGTTIIRSPGNSTIKPENIRIDDYIIAIGFPQNDTALTGRRLIVSTEQIKAPEKTSGIGTIGKLGKTSLTLKLQDKDQVIDITSKTIYKSSAGTIELTDLAVGDTLIYTAKVDDEDLTATILMRIQTASISE